MEHVALIAGGVAAFLVLLAVGRVVKDDVAAGLFIFAGICLGLAGIIGGAWGL